MEYAGFLDWLWHRGDIPCDVVDLSEVEIARAPELGPPIPPVLATSLALLPPENIRHNKLWDLAKPLPVTERLRYRDIWEKLVAENASLRVIAHDKLVSAPISFFDARLMSYVTNDWQKVAMIIGQTLAAELDDDVLQVGDLVLAARIDALVESGHLELQGKSALEMHDSLVRLPQ